MIALDHYHEQGFLSPVPAISPREAAGLRAKLEAFEKAEPKWAPNMLRRNGHIALTWLSDLVRHPKIVDKVAEILGPDLLCWNLNAFMKSPGDGKYVTWHQDATYWGLSSNDVLTAWIALTPSNPENGCMRVVPGSHKRALLSHKDFDNPDNLLTRGQEIQVDVGERETVDLVLEPGQMSLHHVLTIHGSAPALGGDRRIGVAVRYIPTSIRQTTGFRDSATLVRGEDRYGHFELEPIPQADMDSAAMAAYEKKIADSAKLLLRKTG